MAKKKQKTDFTAQHERAKYLEQYLEREWAKLRARRSDSTGQSEKSS